MSDQALAREILRQIIWSAETIALRFVPITSPDDFTSSNEGMEKLDAICMQLIALGESVKNLDRATERAFPYCIAPSCRSNQKISAINLQ